MDGIRRSAVFAAVAVVAVTPHSTSGQETGDRLRVTLGASWVEGEAVRIAPDRLELAVAGGGSRVFSRDEITQVEQIVRKSQGKRGFAIGGAVGWVLGGAFLSIAAEAMEPRLTTFSDKLGYFAISAVVFGFPCGLIGATSAAGSSAIDGGSFPVGAGAEPHPVCCSASNRDRRAERACWWGDGSAEHGHMLADELAALHRPSGSKWRRNEMDGIGRSAVFAAVAIVAVTPHSMSGQETGDRLRVTLGASWVEGEAVRIWPDRLELAVAGGGSRVFSRDGITQVERIVRKSQGIRGFKIGGVVGFVLGGAYLSYAFVTRPGYYFPSASDALVQGFVIGGPIFGIPSGLIGAIIGSRIERVSMEPVPGWGGGGTAPGLLLGVQPGPEGGTSLLVGDGSGEHDPVRRSDRRR